MEYRKNNRFCAGLHLHTHYSNVINVSIFFSCYKDSFISFYSEQMVNTSYLLQSIKQHQHSSRNALLDFTHFGYMWTSVNTKKIVASHSVYTLLGLEPFQEFLTVQKWRQFVHSKDLYKLLQAEEKVMLTGEQCSAEYRIITKSGKHIYINHLMQLSAIANSDFKIMSILDDITEQKSAEVILEVMNEGFYELDGNFAFRRINECAENYWDIQRSDLLHNCIWNVFPQYIGSAYEKLITNAKAGNKIMSEVICPVTNHWLHVSVSPHNDGLIVIFYDIQNEKDAEQEVKENKALLQSIFDTSVIGMSVLQSVRDENNAVKNFRIQIINKKLEETTGRTDLKGKLYFDEYPGIVEIGLADVMLKVLETGEAKQMEYYYPHEGFKSWFLSTFTKLDDSIVATNLDITEAKKAEEQVRIINQSLAEKNKELEQRNEELISLSKVASRDLKEPLRKIYTAVEAIITADAQKLSNNGRAHLRRIQSSVQRMGLITEDLLSFINISEDGKEFSTVDLNEVLKESKKKIQKFIVEKNAQINAEPLPIINGNFDLLTQLFKNILHNAIKFQPDHTPGIDITSTKKIVNNSHFIQITFKDNGIGFNQQDAETMFNLFTRLQEDEKFHGSGMGLAICKKIMALHNGFIEASGVENTGAEVCCYFPEFNQKFIAG